MSLKKPYKFKVIRSNFMKSCLLKLRQLKWNLLGRNFRWWCLFFDSYTFLFCHSTLQLRKILAGSCSDVTDVACIPSFALRVCVKIPRPFGRRNAKHRIHITVFWRLNTFSNSITNFYLSTLRLHVDFPIAFLVFGILIITEYAILIQNKVPRLPRILEKSAYKKHSS